jgi:hypothetical protein
MSSHTLLVRHNCLRSRGGNQFLLFVGLSFVFWVCGPVCGIIMSVCAVVAVTGTGSDYRGLQLGCSYTGSTCKQQARL